MVALLWAFRGRWEERGYFQAKTGDVGKGIKATGAKNTWGSVWQSEEHAKRRGKKVRRMSWKQRVQSGPGEGLGVLFIRKRKTAGIPAEVLRYHTGVEFASASHGGSGAVMGERRVNVKFVSLSVHCKSLLSSATQRGSLSFSFNVSSI